MFGGSTEAAWGLVRQPQDLAPSSSCPVDQDDALGSGSSTILGQGPWRLGGGRSLAEQDLSRGAGLCSGWVAGGAVLADWEVGADLGRLELHIPLSDKHILSYIPHCPVCSNLHNCSEWCPFF